METRRAAATISFERLLEVHKYNYLLSSNSNTTLNTYAHTMKVAKQVKIVEHRNLKKYIYASTLTQQFSYGIVT